MDDIKSHPFFAAINWKLLLAKKVKVPFVPVVTGESDIGNIDPDFTNEEPRETLVGNSSLLKTMKIDQFTYDGRDRYLQV